MTLFSKFKPRRASGDRYNEAGHEVLSDKPMAIPLGFKRPETLHEQVARLVRTEAWSRAMHEAGYETFDESNDFGEDDDDFEPFSAHEMVFDPILNRDVSPSDFLRNQDEYRKKYQEAHKNVKFTEEEPRAHSDKKTKKEPSSTPKAKPEALEE